MPSLEKRPVKSPHRELSISHFSESSIMTGILYYCAGLFCHPFPRPVHLYFHFDHVTFPSVIWLEPQHQCLGAANATRVTKQQRRPGRPLIASFPSFRWGDKGTDGIKPHASSLELFLPVLVSRQDLMWGVLRRKSDGPGDHESCLHALTAVVQHYSHMDKYNSWDITVMTHTLRPCK